MHKICQIIFSTNRVDYLTRTLEAQRKFLDCSGCSVDKLLIDDFPKGRDDKAITTLANDYGYMEFLHDQNMGIGATWEHAWQMIRNLNYDYVWHQEDDVEILEPVVLTDLIDALGSTLNVSQVVLKRQPWYPHEKPSEPLPDDILFPKFRGEFSGAKYYFTPIASLYAMDWVRFDYRKWYRDHYPNDPIFHTANINEALIGKVLIEGFHFQSLHLKNKEGKNLIKHIGEWSVGKRLLPGEPGYPEFADMDPEKRYHSGSKRLWTEPQVEFSNAEAC